MSGSMQRGPTEGELTDALARGLTEVLRLCRFTDVDEWLEELTMQAPHLALPFVRFTGLFSWDSQFQVIQHVTAAGGFWTAGEFVELRRYCGSRMQGEGQSKAMELYDQARRAVEARCLELGIALRGGYYPSAEGGQRA